MFKIIYQPKGSAKEYAELALNIYRGCTHACTYCYAPAATHRKAKDYFATANPKKDVIARVRHDAEILSTICDLPEILISFVGDPYQPAEYAYGLTRQVIEALIEHNLPFTILTKGGALARRDFDLLAGYDRCRFGVSVNTIYPRDAGRFEPYAAGLMERIGSLYDAKNQGITTWVSLEPVIDPEAALLLIDLHAKAVDHWMIGKINHDRQLEDAVDWALFKQEAQYVLDKRCASYTFKNSILEACDGRKHDKVLRHDQRRDQKSDHGGRRHKQDLAAAL